MTFPWRRTARAKPVGGQEVASSIWAIARLAANGRSEELLGMLPFLADRVPQARWKEQQFPHQVSRPRLDTQTTNIYK